MSVLLTSSPAWPTCRPVLSPGGDRVLQLAPGLEDWLAVVLAVVAGAPAVRHPGGRADLDPADQGPPLHLVPAPRQMSLRPRLTAPRTEDRHHPSPGLSLTNLLCSPGAGPPLPLPLHPPLQGRDEAGLVVIICRPNAVSSGEVRPQQGNLLH